MTTPHSPLLAIFRTPLQGNILAEVYLRDRQVPLSITDLARTLREPFPSVRREVNRLVEAGLLAESQVGRARTLSRPNDSLIVRPLTDLLRVTFGPLPVLADLLGEVEGVQEAYIYGSWAARYRGEPGPPPQDVDVLVVGSVDVDALDAVATRAEARLRREVNIRKVSPQRWREPGDDPFLAHVHDRPLVSVVPARPAVPVAAGLKADPDDDTEAAVTEMVTAGVSR